MGKAMIFSLPFYSHVKPTLPLVTELLARGKRSSIIPTKLKESFFTVMASNSAVMERRRGCSSTTTPASI